MSVDPEQLARRIVDGDRRALARGITLLESTRESDREPGDQLLERLVPRAGRSIRIGIETLAHDIVTETLLGGGYSAHSAETSLPEFMD